MKVFKIKWENIIFIATFIVSVYAWVLFIIDSNVYTLALAVLPSMCALSTAIAYESIAEFRQEVLELYK